MTEHVFSQSVPWGRWHLIQRFDASDRAWCGFVPKHGWMGERISTPRRMEICPRCAARAGLGAA